MEHRSSRADGVPTALTGVASVLVGAASCSAGADGEPTAPAGAASLDEWLLRSSSSSVLMFGQYVLRRPTALTHCCHCLFKACEVNDLKTNVADKGACVHSTTASPFVTEYTTDRWCGASGVEGSIQYRPLRRFGNASGNS